MRRGPRHGDRSFASAGALLALALGAALGGVGLAMAKDDGRPRAVEVLRFVRNDPGTVTPVDLPALGLRSTLWDLRAGPAATLRSIVFVPPPAAPDLGEPEAESSPGVGTWTVRESFLDPAAALSWLAPLASRSSSDPTSAVTAPIVVDPGPGPMRASSLPEAFGQREAFGPPEAFGDAGLLGAAPAPHVLGETWSAEALEGGRIVGVSAEVLGEGWAILPAGPVRCWLIGEELSVRESLAPGPVRAYRYRWESPRLGTVATLRSVDGEGDPMFSQASVFERLSGFRPDVFPLRLYSDQFPRAQFQTLGWSYESGGAISGMTPEGYANAGQLVDDGGASPPTWQFTTPQDVSASVRAGTQVPVSQSCYAACCGFSVGGNDFATRSDNPANAARGFTAVDRVTGASDRFFFRGIVAAEGDAASELRSCFDGSASHNTVLAYEFQHPDGGRFYMQKNDLWANALKTCSQDVWQGGNCSSCTSGTAGYVSRRAPQTGITASVVQEGVLTLPSGHHFDALLLRNTNDFTVYGDLFCSIIAVQTIHQFTYAWLVPHFGNVATLTSDLNVPDATSWTTGGTSLNFSLLPPVSITAGASECDRITLSWNPGSDASRITRYKVYWGTQSGAVVPYPFNSDANAGQVSFMGASATISGLARGTSYFFTVTSIADYAGHTYESLVYPTQATGTTPASAYPAEVAAATASAPARAVAGVAVSKTDVGPSVDVTIAWSALAGEACLDRYAVFAAATPRPASPPGSFPSDPAFADISGLDTDASSTNTSFTYTTDRTASAYYLVLASTTTGQLGPACSYPYPGPNATCP